jgi:hypothetical protein
VHYHAHNSQLLNPQKHNAIQLTSSHPTSLRPSQPISSHPTSLRPIQPISSHATSLRPIRVHHDVPLPCNVTNTSTTSFLHIRHAEYANVRRQMPLLVLALQFGQNEPLLSVHGASGIAPQQTALHQAQFHTHTLTAFRIEQQLTTGGGVGHVPQTLESMARCARCARPCRVCLLSTLHKVQSALNTTGTATCDQGDASYVIRNVVKLRRYEIP